ncbi:WXG100 family type VII secretion target [Lysinimonas soli]|uniref:ESAT-6-like protein n=1 Tax=Lysinimonas soli TaxID=1074233 RepID=A0ABW0NLM1_9MICO
MTRYQVDSEAVVAATGNVRAAVGRIQAEVSGLHSQLVNLQSSWSGQAATAFQGVVGDWKATQQRVEESLAHINAALAQAGQLYADVEQQNARLFHG